MLIIASLIAVLLAIAVAGWLLRIAIWAIRLVFYVFVGMVKFVRWIVRAVRQRRAVTS